MTVMKSSMAQTPLMVRKGQKCHHCGTVFGKWNPVCLFCAHAQGHPCTDGHMKHNWSHLHTKIFSYVPTQARKKTASQKT